MNLENSIEQEDMRGIKHVGAKRILRGQQ
jgi:hypothetical protein